MDLVDVEAVAPAARDAFRPGDAWLAGGTWLFSEPQPGTRRLLDLHAFGWPSLVEHDDGLEIAATCTIAELAEVEFSLVRQCCEALLGSFKIWNEATVGGNLCLALPAGPMTSLATALDAELLIWSGDAVRWMDAIDFVTGPGQNALAPGELLRSMFIPWATLRAPFAFRRASLATHGRSAALVIGRRDERGVTVSVTASVPRPLLLRRADPPADTPWYDDVHGHPEWREHMTRRFVAEVTGALS